MPVNSRFRPDSTLADSSRNLEDISRLTLFFTPASLRLQGIVANDSFRSDPSRMRFWDEADTLSGFVQTLGNLGKPVRRTRYGLSDGLFDPVSLGDEFTHQTDPYFIYDFSRLRYADTRTPFVNVNFAQASKKLQLVEVCISQNISPWWNALINYKRRLSDGTFFNSPTDHYNIYSTQSIRSRNGKYFLNFAGIFQQLQDGINGGIGVDKAGDPLEINPLNTDSEIYASVLRRSGKSLYLHQVFKIFHDSAEVKIKPNLFLEGEISSRFRQYEDKSFQLGNSVYPNVWRDSAAMNEAWKTNIKRIKGGGGLMIGNIYQEFSGGYNEYKNSTGYQDTFSYVQKDLLYKGNYSFMDNQGTLNWRILNRITTGFATARWGEISGIFPIPGIYQNIKSDTLLIPGGDRITSEWRPLSVVGSFQLGEVNPPLMEMHYRGNTFSASGISKNQEVMHIRFGPEWRRADRLKGNSERKKGNYFRVQGFYSSVSHFVGYNYLQERIQDTTGNFWDRAGIEATLRIRIGRFYIEPEVVYQPLGSSSDGMQVYLFEQPDLYGKSSFFYENQLFKKAGLFRFGLDVWGFSNYYGLGYEPGSGLFIPAGQTLISPSGETRFFSYMIPYYFRADVFLTAKIRSAVIFLRLLHVNQGLQYPQYYTTPYYPAWGRVFSFGVNWTFFD